MLFNSYEFIFIFLPITLVVFFAIGGRGNHRIAMSWLVAASLFFYGWWNPAYLGLILGSILFNYAVGLFLENKSRERHKKSVLFFGIVANIGLIGYFKYANFFVDSVNYATGLNYNLEVIILPLAISFFTFQQIAYLVDTYRGETKEYSFLHYCLFVTFFPQLIAGPIVHHKDVMPQFAKEVIYKFKLDDFTIGLTIFLLGLFKKVVIADSMALYATPVFVSAESGEALTFFMAWGGALSYTFQLYFDFSGYTDMAIGIARMFGVRLPVNFNSPYRATSIIDFWRRWHITLSNFLRDYVYFSLGGNRKGKARRYTNIMLTMLIGGLWHGAGWTFVAWGAMHGSLLIVNHLWREFKLKAGIGTNKTTFIGNTFSMMVTFMVISVTWVFFRAETFTGAMNILVAMGDIGSAIQLDSDRLAVVHSGLLLILLVVVFYFPNSQQIVLHLTSKKESNQNIIFEKLKWKPSVLWGVVVGIMLAFTMALLGRESEFLYFQF